jgi:hypothetical protein
MVPFSRQMLHVCQRQRNMDKCRGTNIFFYYKIPSMFHCLNVSWWLLYHSLLLRCSVKFRSDYSMVVVDDVANCNSKTFTLTIYLMNIGYYCVVFLLCFSSFCVPYVAILSWLSTWLFTIHNLRFTNIWYGRRTRISMWQRRKILSSRLVVTSYSTLKSAIRFKIIISFNPHFQSN